MQLNILTRVIRQENLLKVRDSIEKSLINTRSIFIKWHLIFDTSVIHQLNTDVFDMKASFYIEKHFFKGISGDMGHTLLNNVMDKLEGFEWICFIDDDNEMHENYLKRIEKIVQADENYDAIVFSQFVGGKDFTGLQIREAKPENMEVKKIDMAQFTLRMSIVGCLKFEKGLYTADGIFIETLYKQYPDKFLIKNEVLCNYNSLQPLSEKNYTLPRILILDEDIELKTEKVFEFESDELNTKSCSNETVLQEIVKFNPDCILTAGDSWDKQTSLIKLPYDFRKKWIHNEKPNGENAYNCSMMAILNNDIENLISVFTPIYNTKDKLKRTYKSLYEQTYDNWEWVIVNDSTDNETIIIAEDIAKNDPRVKVFDFKQKTKGLIGEAKYRACSLSRGNYLVELDHDDYLLPHALEDTINAFKKYPDSGFVYTDCAEIDENFNSLTYGEGFSFGYGSYREETHLGITFKVANTANINPKTIRHIVGVPNHIRAWKRDIYFEVGGHNRRLSIADDYELIVRTFLKTKFTKIRKCCYLQFYHENNSQNATRSDIQRRIRTICLYYNDKIKSRFEELGKEDWAYQPGSLGWHIESRTGDQENFVNYEY